MRSLVRASAILLLLGIANQDNSAPVNLVVNGSFSLRSKNEDAPVYWSTDGDPAIKQRLVRDRSRSGGHCAKLECTEFSGEGAAFHTMIAQTGRVGLLKDQTYQLTFWAKAERIAGGVVEIALANSKTWEPTGLSDVFAPGPNWERFEFLFRAQNDLPSAISRLQFWFKSTGTLWLDDVVLVETTTPAPWFPRITIEGVKNFIPNSSFECGHEGWGSLAFDLAGSSFGELFRLEGEIDRTVSKHGKQSLKIRLTPGTLPIYSFDYYDPVRRPVRSILAATRGWFHVVPGAKLTLSVFLRADADDVLVRMIVRESSGGELRQDVRVGTEWARYAFAFEPSEPDLFVAIGPDLDASKREAATIWLDAIQLERGAEATAYEPRHPIESFIETSADGNVSVDVRERLNVQLRGFNDTASEQSIRGTLIVQDFFGRVVSRSHPIMKLHPNAPGLRTLNDLSVGRNGYFSASWLTAAGSQTLRLARIESIGKNTADSLFGFNHSYPWDFLMRLARQAGILWWRDWSAKWQTVEPEKGKFDFTLTDQQIGRIRDLGGKVNVLLPFPSASWSTSAREGELLNSAPGNASLQERRSFSYAPKDPDDFAAYAAAVVDRYSKGSAYRGASYEILNEPIITSYALPSAHGYTLDDYLRLLAAASSAMKRVDPQCVIVGGIGASVANSLTREFVAKGGLNLVDVLDVHMYQPPRPPEEFEESFRSLEDLMRAHGTFKPVWITEWGLYADDDPPTLPPVVGDQTMNLARWPSERAATEHIVKFTAIAVAHGVRKIFFHAGTVGSINRSDANSVIFEYGGAPRKMYPGIATLTRLLGVPDEFVSKVDRGSLRAFVFRTGESYVAIAWCGARKKRSIGRTPGILVYDIMGNEISSRRPEMGESPVYLTAASAAALIAVLSR